MFNWLQAFQPNPILFEAGPMKIHWYGFLMVLGGFLGLMIVLRLAKHYQIKKQFIYDLAFYWIIFGVLGGRIYYVIYAWAFYQYNWLEVFKIWQGGLAVHGVIIGGVLATLFISWRKKIKFWQLADISVVGLVLAQVIGRWGNYFNFEIFGKPTDLPWKMAVPFLRRPAEYIADKFFHPTFLYESLGNLVIFGLLIIMHWLIIKKKIKIPTGVVFFSYLILYSILRFNMEFLRIDYSPLVFNIRWAQIMSVMIIIGSIIGIMVLIKKNKLKKVEVKS